MKYPDRAGYKARATSIDAAEQIEPKAKTLRDKVLKLLRAAPYSADEAARVLDEDKLAIRPRFSELAKQHLISDSGARIRNASGKRAIVWELTRPDPRQRSLFE